MSCIARTCTMNINVTKPENTTKFSSDMFSLFIDSKKSYTCTSDR